MQIDGHEPEIVFEDTPSGYMRSGEGREQQEPTNSGTGLIATPLW